MTKSLASFLVLAIAFIALMAFPAYSQISTIDYIGYGWETGGFPVSDPGDELHFVGITDYLDPEFEVDLGVDELTLHVYGLLSVGEVDLGYYTIVTYSGGYLEMYQDSSNNADWGINPPNATVPGTFADGELFFAGEFTDLAIYYFADGTGSFTGNLNGVSGTMIDTGCTGCIYTWGGAFTWDSGAQILEGYDLQIDGVLEIDAAVSTDAATWGSVKSLFNN